MPLELPDGERCFVDANIFYYCFVETPPFSDHSRAFLERVQLGEVVALTDIRALSDCIHKTMLAEISQRFGRSRDGLVGWLKQHPDALSELQKSVEVCDRLTQLRLTILPRDTAILSDAVTLAQSYQMLLNDASIVAQMQRHAIPHLATNDDDFDRVPGITVWKPRPSTV
jgi:predicted nucleic acid-binding protein